jgi:hypothetical protein
MAAPNGAPSYQPVGSTMQSPVINELATVNQGPFTIRLQIIKMILNREDMSS